MNLYIIIPVVFSFFNLYILESKIDDISAMYKRLCIILKLRILRYLFISLTTPKFSRIFFALHEGVLNDKYHLRVSG